MSLNQHNPMNWESTGEDTLRLIAELPAPEGLERRVHTALRAAPRHGRVLAWPLVLRADAAWVRAAAAAAIVFVVAGGGWGVYSRVELLQSGKAPAVPARVGSAGGFSGAGARRTPETLDRPVLSRPVVSEPVKPAIKNPAPKKSRKKVVAGFKPHAVMQAGPAAK